ncbi:STAS domain-containing protein [Streptomyces virginiae]|uniref:STAS domain-containing protein n=1 Tax=Streptomyces virginiae TaxID=1961 RepID=UPI0022595B86|nr:STAS domain-containing protein [Streptomyces virginiae]MCX5277877.1 STAS domain-containing protein [Streptomyces virginiae]
MTTALIDLRTVACDHRGLRIALAGELDLHTAGRVEPRLAELAGFGHRNMLLDLSEMSFCDSSGIELFLRLHQRCRSAGTQLLLCGVRPLLLKSIRVLGVDRGLPLAVT